MSTTTAIRESLAAIDSEIERLTAARNALAELVSDEGTEDEAPARRRRAPKSDDTAKESHSTRRPSKSTRSSRAAKRNSDGNGESRRDQIATLLDQGMSPREIGDELGIAPNYVYHVKRSL